MCVPLDQGGEVVDALAVAGHCTLAGHYMWSRALELMETVMCGGLQLPT